MLDGDDIGVAGGGNEDVADWGGLFHGHHFVAVHRRLQRADRIDFRHQDPGAGIAQGIGRALAHIAMAGNHRDLARHHHIGGAADAVNKGLPAAINVVELGFGDAVVDVDGGHQEAACVGHVVEPMDTGCGLFREAFHVLHQLRMLFVHQQREVTAVVQNHVGAPTIRAHDALLDAPQVLFFALALPRKDGKAVGGNGGGGVVLGRENVARRPADFGAQRIKGLDQHGRLDGHMEAADHPCPGKRLFCSEFFAQSHEPRHFALRDRDLLTAPVGQRHIGDLVVGKFWHSRPFIRLWPQIGPITGASFHRGISALSCNSAARPRQGPLFYSESIEILLQGFVEVVD